MSNFEVSKAQVKVLWVSAFAPRDHAKDAGTYTFTKFYRFIAEDARFSTKLVCYENHEPDSAEQENKGRDIVILQQPRSNAIFRIADIDWKLNPYSKTCGLMPNTVYKLYKREILRLKKDGYQPGVIALDWTQVVLLAPFLRSIYPDTPIVATEHDVAFVSFGRWAQYAHGLDKSFKTIRFKCEKRAELNALKLCDLILPLNRENVGLLESKGIEPYKLGFLVPAYHGMWDVEWKGEKSKDILFFGALGRLENSLSVEWFIDNVLPYLIDREPLTRFVALGANPPDSLKSRQSDHFVVPGYVDDICPYFENCCCLAAPLVLGAGIKIKILESMSSGIPVLTNAIGIEGIPAVPGRDYLRCESPEDYIEGILRLFDNPELGRALSEASRRMVRHEFNTAASMDFYANNLIELANRQCRSCGEANEIMDDNAS